MLPIIVPKFLNIYFIAVYAEQPKVRQQHISNLDSGVINGLQRTVHDVKLYVNGFKIALEYMSYDEAVIISLSLAHIKNQLQFIQYGTTHQQPTYNITYYR